MNKASTIELSPETSCVERERAPPPLSPPDISQSGYGPRFGKRKGPIAGS
jgi:hypothetical protein